MARKSLNAEFLSADELERLGVVNAAARNILIHRTCVILDFESISFGKNIRIDPHCVITCKNLCLGDYIHIAGGCTLSGGARISMENFSGLSNHCLVYSASDDYSGHNLTNPMVPLRFTKTNVADVHIGQHAILGARTTVLPWARIGEGASTGIGTLVKHDLAEWTIYAGVPAAPLKARARGCLKQEAALLASLKTSK